MVELLVYRIKMNQLRLFEHLIKLLSGCLSLVIFWACPTRMRSWASQNSLGVSQEEL